MNAQAGITRLHIRHMYEKQLQCAMLDNHFHKVMKHGRVQQVGPLTM